MTPTPFPLAPVTLAFPKTRSPPFIVCNAIRSSLDDSTTNHQQCYTAQTILMIPNCSQLLAIDIALSCYLLKLSVVTFLASHYDCSSSSSPQHHSYMKIQISCHAGPTRGQQRASLELFPNHAPAMGPAPSIHAALDESIPRFSRLWERAGPSSGGTDRATHS